MLINLLDLLLGKPVIPEGFPVMLSQRFGMDNPVIYFRYTLDPEYYFLLERIRCSYPDTDDGDPANDPGVPAVSIYRDRGQMAFQNDAIGMRLIACPGETDGGIVRVESEGTLNNMLFDPASVLAMDLPHDTMIDSVAEVVAIGRYIHKSQAGHHA